MKILAYTSPARGHLFPVVPILCELRRRGHDVSCRTLVSHVDDLRALGIRAGAISAQVGAVAHDDWKAASPSEAQQRAMRTFARRAPLDAADLDRAAEAEEPDALLVDIMSFGALAAAEASGLPWGSWLPYPAWLRGPGIPPYGPGLVPLAGPEGLARDSAVAELSAETAQEVTAAVNAERRAAGLAMLAEPEDVLLRPPLLLYLTAVSLSTRAPHGRPRSGWSGPAHGSQPRPRFNGWQTTRAALSWSRPAPSTKTTGAWSPRHSPRSAAAKTYLSWQQPRPRASRTTSRRPTAASNGSQPTASSSRGRLLSSVTAAWGSLKRPWPRASPSVPYRSDATSLRWHAAWRSAEPAPGCQPQTRPQTRLP
jgi:hypothetical protein